MVKNLPTMQGRFVLVAQSCPTVCSSIDCSPPGFSVHGILQARILEWVAMLSSRGSSLPQIEPWSPALQVDSSPSEQQGKGVVQGSRVQALG